MTVGTPLIASVMVGREPELDALRDRPGAAKSGAGGTVCVSGEAGVGKTRLLAELEVAAEQPGAVFLRDRLVAQHC